MLICRLNCDPPGARTAWSYAVLQTGRGPSRLPRLRVEAVPPVELRPQGPHGPWNWAAQGSGDTWMRHHLALEQAWGSLDWAGRCFLWAGDGIWTSRTPLDWGHSQDPGPIPHRPAHQGRLKWQVSWDPLGMPCHQAMGMGYGGHGRWEEGATPEVGGQGILGRTGRVSEGHRLACRGCHLTTCMSGGQQGTGTLRAEGGVHR